MMAIHFNNPPAQAGVAYYIFKLARHNNFYQPLLYSFNAVHSTPRTLTPIKSAMPNAHAYMYIAIYMKVISRIQAHDLQPTYAQFKNINTIVCTIQLQYSALHELNYLRINFTWFSQIVKSTSYQRRKHFRSKFS